MSDCSNGIAALEEWCRHFGTAKEWKEFASFYTSDEAIGDAYEITALRLAVGHNWTSYWNLIEYAFFVYDDWCFKTDQACHLVEL